MEPALEPQMKAILTLLSDPDKGTVDLVRQTLVDMGPVAIASLQKAGEGAVDDLRERLTSVVDEIRQVDIEARFQEFSDQDDHEMDLEEGAFLVSLFGHPDLNVTGYRRRLDFLAKEVTARLSTNANPQNWIPQINHYFFKELGFRGNVQNYYDPENSYINQVLERRTGIPITLATVYLLIAQRVGLPLSGVGLPGHFMLKYEQGKTCIFIDAFNSGRALTRDDCIRFLLNSGYEVQEECFLETTPRDIICRMLRNLIYAYHRIGDRDRACRLTRLIHILQLSPQE